MQGGVVWCGGERGLYMQGGWCGGMCSMQGGVVWRGGGEESCFLVILGVFAFNSESIMFPWSIVLTTNLGSLF